MGDDAAMQDAIPDRLRRIVAGLDIAAGPEPIGDRTKLFEGGLGLDSFAVLELIVGIEREFHIEFPESDLAPESFHDMGILAAVIARILRVQR